MEHAVDLRPWPGRRAVAAVLLAALAGCAAPPAVAPSLPPPAGVTTSPPAATEAPAPPAAGARPRAPAVGTDASVPPPDPAASAPTEKAEGQTIVNERGLASWYGRRFHGRRTASGEPYDMNGLTAAHRTLPFGTRVRVRSVRTGKEVVVRINDRGPFKRTRIIDLSQAAFAALGLRGHGVTQVELLPE